MTVDWKSEEHLEKVRQAAAHGVFKGANLIRNEVLRLLSTGKRTGRWYRLRGKRWRASAPGEPPASPTGRLLGSIRVVYWSDTQDPSAYINASTEYAAMLEYGTRKMAERPFMRPALANKRDDVEKAITNAIRRVVT